jgi:hypothetical protein
MRTQINKLPSRICELGGLFANDAFLRGLAIVRIPTEAR